MNDAKKYYITIDGEDIEVTEELYYAYKRPAWRESKQRKIRSKKVRSLDEFLDDGFDVPDDVWIEDTVIKNMEYEKLYSAIDSLTDDEQKTIISIYFKNKTEQDVATLLGISQQALHKRKNAIHIKLIKYLS